MEGRIRRRMFSWWMQQEKEQISGRVVKVVRR
jgi:hypothetical protein